MVRSMAVTLGPARRPCFSIPDRSGHLFRHAGHHSRRGAGGLTPVGARRYPHQLGETGAERAERAAADRETDLRDTEVAPAQQSHGPLDAARHEVAVGRLTVGEPELPAEV